MAALIQRLHPAVRLGQRLTLATSGNPLFSRQGDWDAGSPLHCAAMALALLGKLSNPVGIRDSDTGRDARFWDRAWPHYLHGLTLSELASFLWELNCGVRPITGQGPPGTVLRFCARELELGWPVIVALHTRARSYMALAIGVEGRQHSRHLRLSALLLLDPAEAEPALSGFNARLEMVQRLRLVTVRATHRVRVAGAISIRL